MILFVIVGVHECLRSDAGSAGRVYGGPAGSATTTTTTTTTTTLYSELSSPLNDGVVVTRLIETDARILISCCYGCCCCGHCDSRLISSVSRRSIHGTRPTDRPFVRHDATAGSALATRRQVLPSATKTRVVVPRCIRTVAISLHNHTALYYDANWKVTLKYRPSANLFINRLLIRRVASQFLGGFFLGGIFFWEVPKNKF